jgi:hypothetical protein
MNTRPAMESSMQHTYTRRIVLGIGIFLVLMAVLFSIMRGPW